MKAQKVLNYMIDLYDVPEKQATQMLTLEKEYEDAFKDISEESLMLAVKNYWKYKSDKARPTLSKIMAMLPDNFEREKQYNPQPVVSGVPSALKEDFKSAVKWVESIQNPNYWRTPTEIVFANDINYALNKAQMAFTEANQDIVRAYGGGDGKTHQGAILALFYKHTNAEVEVRKHLCFKSSVGVARTMKEVLGSLKGIEK
jgi:hypothetical protein